MWKKDYVNLMYPKNNEDVKIDEAIKLKYQNLPSSLFKYRGVSKYSIENLKNDEVWFNQAANFNDPYECALMLGSYSEQVAMVGAYENIKNLGGNLPRIPEVMELEKASFEFCKLWFGESDMMEIDFKKEYRLHKGEYQENINQRVNKMIKELQQKMNIACFSEVNDSILMWSHYANNHEGFCIEYDFKKEGREEKIVDELQPVIYQDEVFNIGEYFKQTLIEPGKFNKLVEKYAAIIKSVEWKYEKEWRIILECNKGKGFSRELFKPKSIYLGAKMSNTNKEEIVNIATQKNIKVFQMRMRNNEYKLYPERIL
ncbi:DUF2971 domain-containing protein [Bacillus cereus]|nr:DUF2971 domain-containing protein [Bacillus cereus]MEC2745168.1 DUF2971 domain-containing protein [Bacillus cereus]MEC2754599.1 DUF2971 domain-containing protein [Bacillus cereus]MEC2826166.1 DUF2971 domain-containing protein [Bacillus cereus]